MFNGPSKTVKAGYQDRPCTNPGCDKMAAPSHPYCGQPCYERFKHKYLDPHRKILLPRIQAAGGAYQDPEGSWWMHLWGDILTPEKNAHVCFVCGRHVSGCPSRASAIMLHLQSEHNLRWIRLTWQFVIASEVNPPALEILQTFTQAAVEVERFADDDAKTVGTNQFTRRRQNYDPSLLAEDGTLAWYRPDFLNRVDQLRAGLRS